MKICIIWINKWNEFSYLLTEGNDSAEVCASEPVLIQFAMLIYYSVYIHVDSAAIRTILCKKYYPGHDSLVGGPIEVLFVLTLAVFEGLHVDMQFVITCT